MLLCKLMSVIKNFRELTKLSKILAIIKYYKKNVCDESLFKKSYSLENLPINDQNLVLVKEFIFG